MIAHDFVRGTISGLPRSAVDAYRRTGRFPEDVVHPMIADAWSAVAAQKRMTIQGIGLAEVEASRRSGIVQNQVVGAAAWGSFLGEGVEVTRFAGGAGDCSGWTDRDAGAIRDGSSCGDGGKTRNGRWEWSGKDCVWRYDCVTKNNCACWEDGGDHHYTAGARMGSGVDPDAPEGANGCLGWAGTPVRCKKETKDGKEWCRCEGEYSGYGHIDEPPCGGMGVWKDLGLFETCKDSVEETEAMEGPHTHGYYGLTDGPMAPGNPSDSRGYPGGGPGSEQPLLEGLDPSRATPSGLGLSTPSCSLDCYLRNESLVGDRAARGNAEEQCLGRTGSSGEVRYNVDGGGRCQFYHQCTDGTYTALPLNVGPSCSCGPLVVDPVATTFALTFGLSGTSGYSITQCPFLVNTWEWDTDTGTCWFMSAFNTWTGDRICQSAAPPCPQPSVVGC